jgi:translation elongation factor EF-Tu-like GTPase
MSPRWRLTVEDVFTITGRGSVVVGTVAGIGYSEPAIVITPSGETRRVAKAWFDIPCGQVDDGTREIRYGLLLGDIDRQILVPGTIVQSID